MVKALKHGASRFRGLAELLRFFVMSERYGIIDRIGNAVSPIAVKQALFEALRIARSLRASAERVRYNNREILCCEVIHPREGRTPAAMRLETSEGVVYCIPCPRIPTENEIREFLAAVERDIDVAREVAILAQTFPPQKEVSSG